MSALFRLPRPRAFAALLLALGGLLPAGLPGQGPTTGSVIVSVTGASSEAIRGVAVSLERNGAAIRTVATDRAGKATFNGITPGTYTVLVEQFGYQPVRFRDLAVEAGGQSRMAARIARSNGAVTSVEERQANASIAGVTAETFAPAWRFGMPSASEDVMATALGSPGMLGISGQPGLLGANGLLASSGAARLRVNGLYQSLLRNPGNPAEPLSNSLFTRQDVAAGRLLTSETDARYPGASAGVVDIRTPAGGTPSFSPWLYVSPGLGAGSRDNPGDSTALSFAGGARMGGAIMGDTASWNLGVHLFRTQVATANPFEVPAGTTAEQFGAELRAAAQSAGGPDPLGFTVQRVRTTSGATGSGRIGVNIGSFGNVAIQAAGGSWTEKNPLLALDAVNGAEVSLKATDLSVGLVAALGRDRWTSLTQAGIRKAKREWTSERNMPTTLLATEGVAFGTPFSVPGKFDEKALQLSQTAGYRLGKHTVRAGVEMEKRTTNWEGIGGRTGVYVFGDLASFQAGKGAFARFSPNRATRDIVVKNTAGFLQDNWRASQGIDVTLGLRYDKELLPDSLAPYVESLENTTGASNRLMPLNDASRLAPSATIRWSSPDNRSVLAGGAGISFLPFDVATLSEVARRGAGAQVTRATGDLAWPDPGSLTPRPGFSVFVPGIQRPRVQQGHVALTQALGRASLTLRGGYAHTDYMFRRADWNRPRLVPTVAQDGRPVYGDMRQYGGLIVPAATTNFRFTDYDAIYTITGDGYVDHYEFGAEFERAIGHGLDLRIAYAWGKTEDNLIGQLSADPADRLNPFPDSLAGKDWSIGRSDLDVPHRLVADLRFGGTGPLSVTARYRFQSGLPFTPGVPRGVDLNGDGSGGNDPVALDDAIPGLSDLIGRESCLSSGGGAFAERNACRDPGAHALDLGLRWRLSGSTGRKVEVTFDALSLIGSATGIRDHAAVRVDPTGSLQYDGSGRLAFPLVANERFGELLSRRGESRQLRLGIRVEN